MISNAKFSESTIYRKSVHMIAKFMFILYNIIITLSLNIYNNNYKQGGSLRSSPAAPDLYFPSCTSSYIPAKECCKQGCEREELAAI